MLRQTRATAAVVSQYNTDVDNPLAYFVQIFGIGVPRGTANMSSMII